MNQAKDTTLQPQEKRVRHSAILLGGPPLFVLLLALLGWIQPGVVVSTYIGMLGAIIGGVTLGITAKRFLAHSRDWRELLFGILASIAIGVIAIGYIYLVHLKNPFQSMSSLPRIVEQSSIFITFLLAQLVGAQWSMPVLKTVFPKTIPSNYQPPESNDK